MAVSSEFIAEFAKIIDLPIEDDPDVTPLITHGLVPRSEIYDTEPSKSEGGVVIGIYALIVGASMRKAIAHAAEQLVLRQEVNSNYTYDSAHGSWSTFPV